MGEVLLVRNESAEQHYFKVDIELENLEPETGRLIGDLSIRTKTNSIFKKGDILFGKLRPYLKKWHLAQTNGLKSGEIWAFYSTDEFCRNFIYLLVQTENFLKIANISAGTKMPRADWNLISQMSISVPTLPEQQAIGEFFKQLDDIIAFHQRELEKYQQLKQVLLDQLFV